MNKIVLFAAITLFSMAAGVAAQEGSLSSAPKLALFSQVQYDSILALVPAGDSIRKNTNIVSIGADNNSGEIVIVSLDRNGNPVKSVFPAPATQAPKKAGTSVTVSIARQQEQPEAAQRPQQNGRTWFIVETSLKSAIVYSAAYAAAFPKAAGSSIGGFSLLTLGGTLYGSYAFTKDMELGYGKVGLMNYGSSMLGVSYPNLMARFLHNATTIDDGYSDAENSSAPSEKVRAWTAMAGFPLGIYIGSRWGIVDKDDGGKVTLMQYFSQTGAFLLGYTLPLYFVSYDTRPENYVSAASLLTMGLLPAGFYAGYRIAGDRYISAGRGTMPYVTGTLGGLTGLLIPTLFEPDMAPLATARLFVTTTLIGYGCGTWLGLDYHKSIDYSYWQAVFIGASSAAGAAIGCSFPLIAQAAKHQAYTIMGIAGAWSGFYFGEKLSLDLFEKSSRDKRSSAIRFNAPGLAALPLLMAAGKPNASQSVSARFMPPLPVANVEWRF